MSRSPATTPWSSAWRPPAQRLRALWLGIGAATLLRLVFALAATSLLRFLGLLLAGGILLLWVAWKLWREIAAQGPRGAARGAGKGFGAALGQIVLADICMSHDNALAVAGAALEHPMILAAGLAISVLLMGLGAALLASARTPSLDRLSRAAGRRLCRATDDLGRRPRGRGCAWLTAPEVLTATTFCALLSPRSACRTERGLWGRV